MADTNLVVIDGTGYPQNLLVQQNANSQTPYHAEDATQRAALIAALTLLSTHVDVVASNALLTTINGFLSTLASEDAGLATQTTLAAVLAACVAATPAGTNLIGKVGIDQTTPGTTNAVSVNSTASAADATITVGGTAQNLFAGATPANGYCIGNSDPVNDLWFSDSADAEINGSGSIRIPPGWVYETPPGYKPFHAVSVISILTGHAITARKW